MRDLVIEILEAEAHPDASDFHEVPEKEDILHILHDIELDKLLKVVRHVETDDECPVPGPGFEKPERAELLYRGADRDAADSQLLGNLVLRWKLRTFRPFL